jgi:hypothetical protein
MAVNNWLTAGTDESFQVIKHHTSVFEYKHSALSDEILSWLFLYIGSRMDELVKPIMQATASSAGVPPGMSFAALSFTEPLTPAEFDIIWVKATSIFKKTLQKQVPKP